MEHTNDRAVTGRGLEHEHPGPHVGAAQYLYRHMQQLVGDGADHHLHHRLLAHDIAGVVRDGEHKFITVPPGTIGSLVTFRVDGIGAHVGFVIDTNSFLHTTEGTGVVVERLNNSGFRPIGYYDYE